MAAALGQDVTKITADREKAARAEAEKAEQAGAAAADDKVAK
jgi:hypothetical protein